MSNEINVCVPTWEFLKKYEPDVDKDGHTCFYSPYGPLANVEKIFVENQFVDPDLKIRLAIVDEDFELWEGNKTIEEISEWVSEYVETLHDDEFVRMFEKYNLKEGYRLNLLGFRMYFDNNPKEYQNYVSEETYDKLMKYFEGIFGKGNVLIKNEFMGAVDICNNMDSLYEEMISHMKGIKHMDPSYKIVKERLPFADIYLPVLTKYTMEKPLITVDEFNVDFKTKKINVNYLSCLIGFEKESLKFYEVETKVPFNKSDALKGVLKDLKNRTELMLNQFIPDYYLPEHYELQVEAWNKFVKEHAK